MPRASEMELDDGGFFARANPLPNPSRTSSDIPQLEAGQIKRGHKRHRSDNRNSKEHSKKSMLSKGSDYIQSNTIDKAACDGNAPKSPDNDDSQMMTLSGTIQRGRKKDKVIDVELELSAKQLSKLDKAASKSDQNEPCMSLKSGPHVLLFTILFAPIALVISVFTTFYIGTLCWYNVYLYLSEEQSIWHKIFICPLLLVTYPIQIVVSTLALSVYASIKQISWFISRWLREIKDVDKGFFTWLCNRLNIPQCSPYEVVVLNEEQLSSVQPRIIDEENSSKLEMQDL